MINIITLAGEGSRFSSAGIKTPKPLIEIDGVPMIIRALDCLPKCEKYVFVCRTEHIEQYNIDEIIKNKYENCEFVTVDKTTQGMACTVEVGINESSIKDNDSILISCCDYGLKWCPTNYEEVKDKSDVVVWSTINNNAFTRNPSAYSWLEVENDKLIRTHVKEHFFEDSYNNHAIVGTFYFRRAGDFLDSLDTIYRENITTNNEYYIDNMFNTMKNLRVNIFTVDEYYCWGTPEDLERYNNEN